MDKTGLPTTIQEYVAGQEKYLDTIRGCLIGGAAGDALGYPVEFLDYDAIIKKYGPEGIRSYHLDPSTGKALVLQVSAKRLHCFLSQK